MENFAIILAGGKGERFWPVSRESKPKQLLKLISDRTMLEETISRVESFVKNENILVVTGHDLKRLMKKETPALKNENFIIEPVGRNTAPAIGLAAANIIGRFGDGLMFVLSTDHHIKPVGAFVKALKKAGRFAVKENRLVLLGIEPSRPETGYGYIEMGREIEKTKDYTICDVAFFKEKPNRLKAQEYYLDSKHLWNSGIFIWKASEILKEIEKYLPGLHSELKKYITVIGTKKEKQVLREAFERIEAISIDYGVLEKSDSVAVLHAKFTWDDVGSYAALERILSKDRDGNIIAGDNTLFVDTYETTIMNETPGLVVTFGVSDLVVVRAEDVVFIVHKTRIPEMRELLEKVKKRPELEKYL